MSSLLQPISPGEWDEAKARHLLNRAGFGVPHDAIGRLALSTPHDAVASFVDYDGIPQDLEEPDSLDLTARMRLENASLRRDAGRRMRDPGLTDEERLQIQLEIRRTQVEFRREQREAIQRLKRWWLRRMIDSPRPLEEKMTLFWHGHFATSAEKVASPQANYDLHALLRRSATGNFKLLTYEVGCSPAMMLYLDNARSRKEHPNENWARELMELYTLGQGRYTEDDIKAAARAFTGWTTDGEQFVYRPAIHDNNVKVFMGHRGNLNGQDIFDIIFARPDAAEFIASKLWVFFAGYEPDVSLRRELGLTFYRSGYELRPLLRRMFLSRAFYSEKAMGKRIKSPAELVISMVDALEIERPTDPLIEEFLLFAMGRMGQDLFYAPSVKGWPGGRTWISTGTLMMRYNASNFLTQGVLVNISPALRRQVIDRYRNDRRFRRSLREARHRSGGGEATSERAGEAMDMERPEEAFPGPVGFQIPETPLDARSFFARYEGLTSRETIDRLVFRLFTIPPAEQQLRQLLEAFDDVSGEETFYPGEWSEARLQSVLHLMMSTAEFQLC